MLTRPSRILAALAVPASPILFLLALATPSAAQPIVKLDCSRGFPLCGASWHEFNGPSATCSGAHCKHGVTWTGTLERGIGPGGADAVRFRHLPTSSIVEYYLGWGWSNPAGLAPATGECRYPRFWIRVVTPLLWEGPGGGRVGGKFVILGSDGTPDGSRLLLNVRSNKNPNHDPTRWYVDANQNTGLGSVVPNLTAGSWIPVQAEVCLGSAATTKLWVGSSVYSAPTATQAIGSWQPNGWSGSDARVALGAYWQSAGPAPVNVIYEIAATGPKAFEVGRTFDASWASLAQATPSSPAPPSGVRVVPF
jgi:hypothetical protein